MKNNILIRIKLMEKDISQWEFGEMLGVSESTISRWLRKGLDEETQKMICEFLDGNKKLKPHILYRLGYQPQRPKKQMSADRLAEAYADRIAKDVEWQEKRRADEEEWY